jgi:hypothetical protein
MVPGLFVDTPSQRISGGGGGGGGGGGTKKNKRQTVYCLKTATLYRN